jgi:hypothetical protein
VSPARRIQLALILVAAQLVPLAASANERRFTYTYESGTLPKGAREFEVWTTARLKREQFYARFDNRLEFEWGLTDTLMTALYLNTSAITARVGDAYQSEYEFSSISSEWKWKLMDPVADPVGMALYAEFAGGPREAEVEAKLIFDKKIGDVLLATNLIGEYELEWEAPGEIVREIVAELVVGAAYYLTPKWTAGLELRVNNEFEREVEPNGEKEWEMEHSALFAGPTVGYAEESWWMTLTLLPQITALKKPEGSSGSLDLQGYERFNARLLFSFHL